MIADLNKPEAKKPTRDGFGKGLLELGEKDSNVWALSADVSESTRTHWFAEKFPGRFIQVGVAEQNMAGVASGIAHCGKTVFVSAFAAFSPGRNFDQIRVSVCYNDVNVNFHASHSGITVGPDGASHQILEDIALMRSLPNMIVISPADMEEARKATIAAAAVKTPCYIRTSRQNTPVFTTPDDKFEIGKSSVIREGKDVAIFAHGVVTYDSFLAAEKLRQKGIDAAVINCHTIKPVDEEAILKYAKQCGLIVTVEDHQVIGGLGSAVAETVADRCHVPVKRHGIYDRFCESASASELLQKYQLDADGIARKVEEEMKVKK
ncbi:transketolase family protein [Candidatus Micrarchaeota archaeon]|nr:transketolase family protein [Candidatus Micrarchaeota archaeon]